MFVCVNALLAVSALLLATVPARANCASSKLSVVSVLSDRLSILNIAILRFVDYTCSFMLINLLNSSIATIEYEADLRHKNEMARVEAEIKGKLVRLPTLYYGSCNGTDS